MSSQREGRTRHGRLQYVSEQTAIPARMQHEIPEGTIQRPTTTSEVAEGVRFELAVLIDVKGLFGHLETNPKPVC